MIDDSDKAWAARGRFLFKLLNEEHTDDGRAYITIDNRIWVKYEGTVRDYIDAIDYAMEKDHELQTR
jgi:hypothetical protein